MACLKGLEKWRAVAKVELHAHFFGSIRRATLVHLQKKKQLQQKAAAAAMSNTEVSPDQQGALPSCVRASPLQPRREGEDEKAEATAPAGKVSAAAGPAAAAPGPAARPAAEAAVAGEGGEPAAAAGRSERAAGAAQGRPCYGSNSSCSNSHNSSNCLVDGLDGAFDYFAAAYKLVRTEEEIRFAVRQVLLDFHLDNVVYLELRTTLKDIEEENIDANRYLSLLVEELEEAKKVYPLTVKLIISINRAVLQNEQRSREEVDKALAAAARHPHWVVGIDIAGDPRNGDLSFALDRLQREINLETGKFFKKLKWTVHTAEIEGAEKETEAILAARPHRIGHGCFLTDQQRLHLVREGISTEVCPTSNMCTLHIQDLRDHHLNFFFGQQGRSASVCVCTDDSGLFETTLSQELALVAEAYKLTVDEVLQLQRAALAAAFCTDEEKQQLLQQYFSGPSSAS